MNRSGKERTIWNWMVPFPILSLLLWLSWLLLSGFTVAQALLGLVLAVSLPLASVPFWPDVPRVRRPGLLLRFLAMLLWDILVANLSAARRILGPIRHLRPAFVEVPLNLDNDFAIAVLASTVSLTPGTVSADLSADRRTLLVHGLDVEDPEVLVALIQHRYQGPIKEIFQC